MVILEKVPYQLIAGVVGTAIIVSFAFAEETVAPSPDQIGNVFCDARLNNDMGPVDPLLSPALTTAISDALAKVKPTQATLAGLPWQGRQIPPEECNVAGVSQSKLGAEVQIAYVNKDKADANWTDTLLLNSVDGSLRIDDIRFGDGTLRSKLASRVQ